jgi:hypothetical protein
LCTSFYRTTAIHLLGMLVRLARSVFVNGVGLDLFEVR